MEVIVGSLLTLIIGSILLHFVRLGYAMYQLNSTTNYIAHELEKAREMAQVRNQNIGVIFQMQARRYGIDRNGNGKLEGAEAEELPEGVNISADSIVTFMRTGRLVLGSEEPQILISNTRNTRTVSVSSHGSIVID
ncbi:MAG TPA: GspH/FimT family pseudopilin [Blastocatellia bacterium]|nr:GspH/FimT family pseudopilin [Blastocatellia bacterium]